MRSLSLLYIQVSDPHTSHQDSLNFSADDQTDEDEVFSDAVPCDDHMIHAVCRCKVNELIHQHDMEEDMSYPTVRTLASSSPRIDNPLDANAARIVQQEEEGAKTSSPKVFKMVGESLMPYSTRPDRRGMKSPWPG